jgi:integrase
VDLAERIAQINQSLEKCDIRAKDGRLYLRSSHLPIRPGDSAVKRHELALGVSASASGLSAIAKRVKLIDAQILDGKFEWSPWLKGKHKPPETVAEWIERYTADHWSHTKKDPNKENSYHKNYWLYFQKLPQSAPLTLTLMKETIENRSEPASRNREFYCMSYRRLAQFMQRLGALDAADLKQFEVEVKLLKQGYKAEPINPDDLPTDEQILETWQSIKNPEWRWAYGIYAVYGIRPSELFNLDLARFTEQTEALRVFNNTKTGQRLTYPCLPSWRSQFELWDVRFPGIDPDGHSNNVLGEKVTTAFRQLGIWHSPKALRHAWCIRTAVKGVPDSLAARWAGHSVSIHAKTYHQAISEKQQQSIFEEMKLREILSTSTRP